MWEVKPLMIPITQALNESAKIAEQNREEFRKKNREKMVCGKWLKHIKPFVRSKEA